MARTYDRQRYDEDPREDGRIITVREAHVKTAEITVKMLAIAKRQITMAIFRQLQKEDYVDAETVRPEGPLWGRVNYFWRPCEDDHFHVVWQKGEELRRGCVFPEPWGWRNEEWQTFQASLNTQFGHWVMLDLLRDTTQLYYDKNTDPIVTQGVGDYEARFYMPLPAAAVAHQFPFRAGESRPLTVAERNAIERYRPALRDYLLSEGVDPGTDPRTVQEGMRATVKVMDDYATRWRDLVTTIRESDHLFIAA